MIGQTVCITGASSGIGLACAQVLAQKGANLVLSARRHDRLVEIAHKIRQKWSVQVWTAPLDVSNKDSAMSFLERAGQPVIDVLINYAGLARGFSSLVTNDPGDWDEMIDTNLKGLLWVTRPILQQMFDRQSLTLAR